MKMRRFFRRSFCSPSWIEFSIKLSLYRSLHVRLGCVRLIVFVSLGDQSGNICPIWTRYHRQSCWPKRVAGPKNWNRVCSLFYLLVFCIHMLALEQDFSVTLLFCNIVTKSPFDCLVVLFYIDICPMVISGCSFLPCAEMCTMRGK